MLLLLFIVKYLVITLQRKNDQKQTQYGNTVTNILNILTSWE